MLTIDQKKELLSKVENVLNTYNDGDFAQCNISIDLRDKEHSADGKVVLLETLYNLSYMFMGELTEYDDQEV